MDDFLASIPDTDVLWDSVDNAYSHAHLATPSVVDAPTLFDTLSTDALSIILKGWSSPLQENMHRAILSYFEAGEPMPDMPNTCEPVRFLALLFSENSPFRAAAATLVSVVELSWPYPVTSIHAGRKTLSIGPELFEGEAQAIELGRNIFSACGPLVRRLVVDQAPEEGANASSFVEQAVSHVLHYCRNVEEVEFWRYKAPLTRWGTASSFFRAYAANLRKIDWLGEEEDEDGFPDFRKCVNARCVKSRELNTATLVSLLKACGETLEELDILITPVGDSVEVVQAIRKYCKQLRVLDIMNLEDVIEVVGQESYASLIRQYGSHMKSAGTGELAHEHLLELAYACPSLEVIVNWVHNVSVDWRHIHELGPRVASLSFHSNLLYGCEYPHALEQCSNLRKLYMADSDADDGLGLTDEVIANVFAPARFPKLEDLTIEDFMANKRNMALIASCTANLKAASFGSFESDSKVSAFQPVADANTHLRDITVVVVRDDERSSESALQWLSELVNIFRKCRKLWFEIPSANEEGLTKEHLIHVCKVLPCRDVDVYVEVGDVKYQYPK